MNEQLAQIYGHLHGMWRFRWSALFITWVVAIIGWVFVFSLPNQFNVKSTVYVDTSSVMKPLLKGLALEMDTRDELAVMSQVLLSRKNLLFVMRETDMDLEVRNDEDREGLLEGLKKSIRIKGGSGRNARNIYELSYTGDSGKRAYQVVSSLLNTMIEDTLSSTRTDTVMAQKFLDTQINEYEERLSEAEQQLAEFKKDNVGYMPDEKGNYYARLQRAQDSVDAVRSRLKLAQQRYAELKKQLSGEKPLIDSQSFMSGSAGKIRDYEEQLKLLLNSYTDKHPDVLALKATIDNLKTGANTADGRNASATGNSDTLEFNPVYQEMKVEANKASIEVGSLKIQLDEKEQYVKKLKGSIDIIPEVEAKLTRLNRGYEITRARYLDLVERRESARLAQSAGQSTSDIKFRVIEPAIIPSHPSGPARLLFLVGALVVALGAGLGWSFLRFMLEPSFFDLRQVTEKTGLPILGTVSLFLSPQHKIRRRMQLTSFLSVTCLLVAVFSGAMIFNKQGTAFVGAKVSDLNQKLKEY
ncbi:MAG: chain-length determining protein [Gammaproteobacteria bacterium]|nr:chain-length determining protein [Gammaproteobacteria bacterium]